MSSMLDFGKYYFVQEYEDYKLTQEFDGQTDLHEMIANFESFLRASGFHFDGYLDIVEHDLPSVDDMDSPSDNISFENLNQYNLMSESLRKSAD